MKRAFRLLILLLASGATCLPVRAEPRLMVLCSSNEVARAFRYPAGALRFEDGTEAARQRHGDSVVAAFSVTGNNRTFAPLAMVVAKEKTLLTDSLKSKIEAALNAPLKEGDTNAASSLSRFEIAGVGTGYVGLGVFGSGGEEQIALFHASRQGLDIQIKVSVPFEPPLEVSEETRTYHDALLNSPGFVRDALERCLRFLATNSTQTAGLKVEPTNTVAQRATTPSQGGQAASQAETGSKLPQAHWSPFGWVALGILVAAAVIATLLRRR